MSAFSGSSYGRVLRCAASAVLPRTQHESARADVGSALHEHLSDRIRLGLLEALDRLPILATQWRLSETDARIFEARARHFQWIPPAGAISEQALALFDDTGVRTVVGGRGEYALPPGALVPATIDVMWSEPEPLRWSAYQPGYGAPECPEGSVLWTVEVKTGLDVHVEPVEFNAQARLAALLAGRWTDAALVMPAVVYWRKGMGEWDVLPAPIDARGLDAIGIEVRDALDRVESQRRLLAAGEPLELVEGSHCTYCPAEARCPAKTAMLKGYLGAPAPLGEAPLSVDEARRLAVALPMMDRFVRAARTALRAHVAEAGPIDLGGENLWGPHEVEETRVVAALGEAVLAEEVGVWQARAAVRSELPRWAIEGAVKAHLEASGVARGVAPMMRRIYGRLGAAGALLTETKTQWSAYRRPPDPDELEAALRASVDDDEFR